jgi:hypothetical protein
METTYPQSDTIRLTITGTGTMPLKIRAPFWLEKPVSVAIDDVPQAVLAPAGTYFTINKAWSGSSIVTIVLPQTIRFEKSPDNANVGGVMYGAQLLAGCYGNIDLSSMPTLNASTVQKISSYPLKFSGTASTGNVTLVPYYQMHNQRYSVYWNLTNIPIVKVAMPGAEKINQTFQMPEISKESSRLKIGFSAKASRNTPLNVSLYILNGARITNYEGMLHSGERIIMVNLPEMPISPNFYVCKVNVGNQSFTKLIGSARY